MNRNTRSHPWGSCQSLSQTEISPELEKKDPLINWQHEFEVGLDLIAFFA